MSAPEIRTRESSNVKLRISPVTRLAAVTLLVGIAAVGCARHDGSVTSGQSQTTTPARQSQAAQASPTVAPVAVATDTPAPSESAGPIATGQTGANPGVAETQDPLDGELTNINNLVNGIDGSISGSDAGPAGGE
jgi:hypothetical protein